MSAGKVFTELAVLVCALTFVGQSSSNLVISQSYGGLYELSSLTEPATQDAEATLLETGKLMTRPIAGGQVHSYKFDASAGDFLSVVVEQHAVDVVVRLLAPNGKSIAQVDSPNGAYGPEPLLAIIDATGSYRLEVKTFPGGTTSGSYEIGLRELRKATQADKDRVPIVWAAQHALDRGVQLANQGPKSAAEALVAYEEALGLWRQLNEPYWQGLSLANMAQIYGFLGALEKALEYYNQALSLQKAATDNRGAAATLDALGEIYFQQGEKPKALDYFNQALTLRRVAGDIRGEGLTLVGLGRVYSSIGETKKALDFFNQALALLKTTDDRGAEAVALGNIGKIYFHVGDLQKALELYNRALEIFVAVRNRSAEAKILIDIGSVYNDLGDKEKALDLFSKGLTSFRALGDGNSEAITLNNLGLIYNNLGERQKALEYFNQALIKHRAIRNRSGEATTLNNIGALYYLLGEGQKALESYTQALALHQALVNPDGEATALNNIGTVYGSLGEKDKAVDFFNRALVIRRRITDKNGEANTLNSLATMYEATDRKKALEFLNQALVLFRETSQRHGEANTLANIGAIHEKLGDSRKALEFYNDALALQMSMGDRYGEATTRSNIGALYQNAGENRKALEFHGSALTIQSAIGDRPGEALTQINLMLLAGDYNRPLAILFGKRAVNLLQQLRAGVVDLDKEQQKTFLKKNERTYRILAYMLLGSGRLPEAHEVLNLFKDQQFFDFNHGAGQAVSSLTLSPRESTLNATFEQATQRIAQVGGQLSELSHQIDPELVASEKQQLEAQLQTASEQFMAAIRQADSEFLRATAEGTKVTETRGTVELQKTLADLTQQTGQKAVAVYTLLDKELEGEGDGSFSALVVTPDNITFTTEPIKADAVNKKALQLWGLLQSDQYDPRPLAEDLYSVVFKPIENLLPKGTNTILWSLDGNLRYLPMGALYDGKQYLIERYNHVVFTRPDRERLLRAVSPRWTGLGLGSSEAHTVDVLGDKISFSALPGVTAELRALFRQTDSPNGLLEGAVLPDAKFTKAAMLAALKQKPPLVHISSHFSFRPGDEARSFLLLGDGTAMTLEEMKQHLGLFNGVELLTLSACNTAAQQAGNGREIDGFAELAQRLGAASVMATLWPVADNSTPWLMRQFYQTRQSDQHLSKAEAFRLAQLALLNGTAQTRPLPPGQKGAGPVIPVVVGDGKRAGSGTRADMVFISAEDAPPFKRDESKPFAHPYYWAPFILIGNWK